MVWIQILLAVVGSVLVECLPASLNIQDLSTKESNRLQPRGYRHGRGRSTSFWASFSTSSTWSTLSRSSSWSSSYSAFSDDESFTIAVESVRPRRRPRRVKCSSSSSSSPSALTLRLGIREPRRAIKRDLISSRWRRGERNEILANDVRVFGRHADIVRRIRHVPAVRETSEPSVREYQRRAPSRNEHPKRPSAGRRLRAPAEGRLRRSRTPTSSSSSGDPVEYCTSSNDRTDSYSSSTDDFTETRSSSSYDPELSTDESESSLTSSSDSSFHLIPRMRTLIVRRSDPEGANSLSFSLEVSSSHHHRFSRRLHRNQQ